MINKRLDEFACIKSPKPKQQNPNPRFFAAAVPRFSALLLLPLPSFPKHAAGAGGFDFDYFLSLIEFSCLLSSAFASVCVVVVACLKKELLATIGSKAAVWGTLALVFGVLSGAWIRRRQWRRVCRETVKDGLEVNLLQRIEKLEEDLRSTSAISKVLSRELEKLEISVAKHLILASKGNAKRRVELPGFWKGGIGRSGSAENLGTAAAKNLGLGFCRFDLGLSMLCFRRGARMIRRIREDEE
ncbi:uncharacterized protein DS421_12g368740 [Arachis hypogaea]|nr:uncharacterized protein DS421_12g368740 [Arachis hypogaea]